MLYGWGRGWRWKWGKAPFKGQDTPEDWLVTLGPWPRGLSLSLIVRPDRVPGHRLLEALSTVVTTSPAVTICRGNVTALCRILFETPKPLPLSRWS